MRRDLIDAIARQTDAQQGDGPTATAIGGLTLLRANQAQDHARIPLKPALCVVAQGAKVTSFGNKRLEYGAGQALVVGIEMPAITRVVEASPREPYLSAVIELDPAAMRAVLEGMDAPPTAVGTEGHGVFVTHFDGPLADCTLRAVRMLDTPKAIPLLYPALMREICYWLLAGPHGGEIARMTLGSSHEPRVIRAIHALRARFAKTVRIEELASIARISPSAFHRQFKALTAMTPLQYQKQLRLLEARRLMVSSAVNAETAAFKVGYESPSQFSREYARMFGKPPRRDAAALRIAPG